MFTYSVYFARCKRHLIYNLIGYWDFDKTTTIVLCCFDKDQYEDNYLKTTQENKKNSFQLQNYLLLAYKCTKLSYSAHIFKENENV